MFQLEYDIAESQPVASESGGTDDEEDEEGVSKEENLDPTMKMYEAEDLTPLPTKMDVDLSGGEDEERPSKRLRGYIK